MSTDLKSFCLLAVMFGTQEKDIPAYALDVLVERLESLRILNWTDLRKFHKDSRKRDLDHWMDFALYKSKKVNIAWRNRNINV